MNKTEQRVQQIMSIVLNIPADQITLEATQDTYPTWDSLKHLDLVVALEEEFDINIPTEEIGNLLSLKLIGVITDECLELR